MPSLELYLSMSESVILVIMDYNQIKKDGVLVKQNNHPFSFTKCETINDQTWTECSSMLQCCMLGELYSLTLFIVSI